MKTSYEIKFRITVHEPLIVDDLPAMVIIISSDGVEADCYPAIHCKRTAREAIGKPSYPTGERIMDIIGIDVGFGYTKAFNGKNSRGAKGVTWLKGLGI